jgi:transcriptional regulator with XRE-family HTH domain
MQLTLKRARGRRRLSLGRVGQLAGVSKSTVLRIERGDVKPLHETVVALEAALDLAPGSLKFPKAS